MEVSAMPDHGRFIAAFSETSAVEGIHQVCADICQSYGFERFLYCAKIPTSLVKPSIIVISGYPPDWREHYNAQNYMYIDPTVTHAVTRITPLKWQDIDPQDRRIRKFLGEAGEHGLRTGLSLPVHGTQGDVGMFNLARSATGPPEETNVPALHLLSCYLHEAVRRIIEIHELPPRPGLTPREIECLLWAAEGKTSWETSQILSISERTVIFHLQNASSKLNVTNRQHAVARAISLGLLGNAL
jgi:LuxR family transcriptional activator of bioluminescence operon